MARCFYRARKKTELDFGLKLGGCMDLWRVLFGLSGNFRAETLLNSTDVRLGNRLNTGP